MSNTGSDHRAVILAAGKGTRMKSELPKVALPLAGKPMLFHVMENLVDAGIARITVVVGYKKELVMEIAASVSEATVDFAEQREQKGTAHAVLAAEDALWGYSGALLVTNGDMPLIRSESFRNLLQAHVRNSNAVTVLSSIAENPQGYGRLVRDVAGRLMRIVEEKDATDEIRKITEVNSGTYVFQAPAIFDTIRRIGTDNKQNEYYLPDVVALQHDQGRIAGSFILQDANEALGANSIEDLRILEERYKARV